MAAPRANPAPTPSAPNTPGSSQCSGLSGRSTYDALATISPPSPTTTAPAGRTAAISRHSRTGFTPPVSSPACSAISTSRAASRSRIWARHGAQRCGSAGRASAMPVTASVASPSIPTSGRRFLRRSTRLRRRRTPRLGRYPGRRPARRVPRPPASLQSSGLALHGRTRTDRMSQVTLTGRATIDTHRVPGIHPLPQTVPPTWTRRRQVMWVPPGRTSRLPRTTLSLREQLTWVRPRPAHRSKPQPEGPTRRPERSYVPALGRSGRGAVRTYRPWPGLASSNRHAAGAHPSSDHPDAWQDQAA